MRPRRLSLAAAVVVAATSVACSGEEPRDPPDPEFTQQLSQDIADARAGDATAEQIATLEEAQQTGEITFEAYDEAVSRALRCMREQGVDVHDNGVIEQRGVRIRTYGVPVEAEEADPREPVPGVSVHRCIAEHSFWVQTAYETQPSSVEAREAYFEQYREAIVVCLADQGIEVEPDISEQEMMLKPLQEEEKTQEIYGRCMNESGYMQP